MKGRAFAPSMGVHADVAQLVEHHLAKVGVAGSNPVVRSRMSVYLERPPTPRELDEIAKAKRPPGTFLVVAGCIGLVVILALIVWSLAT